MKELPDVEMYLSDICLAYTAMGERMVNSMHLCFQQHHGKYGTQRQVSQEVPFFVHAITDVLRVTLRKLEGKVQLFLTEENQLTHAESRVETENCYLATTKVILELGQDHQ